MEFIIYLWHCLGILLYFAEFIRTLVYWLGLWIYPKAVLLRLFYCCLLCYYIIYLFITFVRQRWRENRFSPFRRQRLLLFLNFDRQAVLCSMFVSLFCNCFVPFVPLILSPNFIFSNFKTVLLCHHFILLVSFNDFFCKFVTNTKF